LRGVARRCEFLGYVSNERLLDLYARCLAVYHGPVDEDYGLVTIEAMKAHKAVLTAHDSGGAAEFVVDGESGYRRRASTRSMRTVRWPSDSGGARANGCAPSPGMRPSRGC